MPKVDPYYKKVQNARNLLRKKLQQSGVKVPVRRTRKSPQVLENTEEQLRELASCINVLVLFENTVPTVGCQHCGSVTRPVLTDGQSTTCAACLNTHEHVGGDSFLISTDESVLDAIVSKESKDTLDYLEKMVALKLLIKHKEGKNLLWNTIDLDAEGRTYGDDR